MPSIHSVAQMQHRKQEKIEIIVANDGVNPSNEVIERIKALLLSQDISEGYGINNVNKRLQIEFGSSYGLRYEISDSEEKNLLAIITLPPIKDWKERHEKSNNCRWWKNDTCWDTALHFMGGHWHWPGFSGRRRQSGSGTDP